MNRRSFLGSAIGLILATKLPFIAEAPIKLYQDEFEAQKHVLYGNLNDCKGIYKTTDGIIKTTELEYIEREDYSVMFKFQDWMATSPVTIEGMTVIRNDGLILSPKEIARFYTGPQLLQSGDTLKGTYTLSW